VPSSSSKIKRKEKENQYKIRKIKIVSVLASHNIDVIKIKDIFPAINAKKIN